ncbi:MAG: methylcobalamin:coenzyme M methyltransferase [Lentisphaerae bacterium ADurb.BinA184]|nr:MAG: methylcobalamin:coenzyme M methyltransferase [Lentisphaerae bacterium ADurb.BinA184]
MTSRERLEAAWAFRQADRVPIELELPAHVLSHPRAARLRELAAEHVDNFVVVNSGVAWGFFGLPTQHVEEEIESVPGSHRRVRHTHTTPAGVFTAVTWHPTGGNDYHWEKRFVSTVDELRRLAEAPRRPLEWLRESWAESEARVGHRGLPMVGLMHPLGTLIRSADFETVYTWFLDEAPLVHRFLAATNEQVAATVETVLRGGMTSAFVTWAHEMMIPPWAGRRLFEEFVFPYDKRVNDVIHRFGGRRRAHCHGRCGAWLERFADMGIDSLEPLEHAPRGDVELADAKRRVGGRVLLSGNVADETFCRRTPQEVREEVRQAVQAAARGGGFTLKTSGSDGGTSMIRDDGDLARAIANCEAYLLAGLEFGRYA